MYRLTNVLLTILGLGLILFSGIQNNAQASEKNNLYLVIGSEGPGFTSPQQAIQILENGILPTFEAIQKLKAEGKVITGGLPIGDRAFVMIVQASSNAEVDRILRSLPAWSALEWKVKALQSFKGRADQERQILDQLKAMVKK